MCSQHDVPPYDPPTPTRPRRYELSGDAPATKAASTALGVLDDMLAEAEERLAKYPASNGNNMRVLTLREARRRIAAL